MSSDLFVHLHVHSKFSLDSGVASVEALARAAAERDMPALALTDHNSLAGVVGLERACRHYGVQPIYGVELDALPARSQAFSGKTYEVLLLSANDAGYANLAAVVSEAWRRQTDLAPPHAALEEAGAHRDGLVLVTGWRRTELHHYLARNDVEGASQHIEKLVSFFGRDRVAFALSDFGDPETARINAYLAELAEFLRVTLVATNDVCYIEPEDDFAWRFLQNMPVPGPIYPRRFLEEARTRHLATADEMRERLPRYEAALPATVDLASRCRTRLMTERRRFPAHNFQRGRDAESDLWDRAFQRATRIYGELDEHQKERLNLELDYIRREELADYYQLLCQISQYLVDEHITRGTGQGQLLTSMVAYVLGLTEIDPLEYKLHFFGDHVATNGEPPPETQGPPVFSIALPARSFPLVYRYLRETYGSNSVARAGAYDESKRGKLFSRLCEWAQLPSSVAHELIAKNTLDNVRDKGRRLVDLLDPSASSIRSNNPKFLAFLLSRLHPRLLPLKPLEGRLAISGEDLDRLTPRARMGTDDVAQIAAVDLAAFGLPQIHLVTKPVLNVLDEALDWIAREHGEELDLSSIPLDDRRTFELLGAGQTNGAPPFDTATMKVLLRRHNPKSLPQLVKVHLELAPDDEKVSTDEFTSIFMDCLLGYRCAYLKAHYPVSFMAAMLNARAREPKELGILWREVDRLGIRPLLVNINNSPYDFAQANQAIRVGLRVVERMGPKAFEEIDRMRRGGEFTDLADFCRRTDPKLVPRSLIENLIRAGAFDCFGQPRAQMLAPFDQLMERYRPRSVENPDEPDLLSEAGVDVAPAPDDFAAPRIEEASLQKLLNGERQVAGFVMSQSPLAPYRQYLDMCRVGPPHHLGPKHDGKRVFIAGCVDHTDREGPALEGAAELLLDFEGVAVQARRPYADNFAPAIFSELPLLIGGTLRMRGPDPSLSLKFCAPLRDLVIQSRRARRLILNVTDEDKVTLRLILAQLRLYPGTVDVEIVGFQRPGFIARRLLTRIDQTKVFWCPPLADALRQILPEDNIVIKTNGDE